MKKIVLPLVALVVFSSHVMYLKIETYFLEPNTFATIQLFNGTFDKSENVIDRDRMLDASLLGNGTRVAVKESQWSEKDSVTLLNFTTGDAGTWVAGISTATRSIEMDAEAFNTYLEHEGILDMLKWRKENDQLDGAAIEKYSKHVKAIFQVGDQRSEDWQKSLGYPIEFIPLENPYEKNTGDSIRVKLLFKGQPLANQLVYADFKALEDRHSHDTEAEHGHSHDTNTEEHGHAAEAEHGHSHDKTAEHSHDTEKAHQHEDATAEKHSHGEKDSHATGHNHDDEKSHSHDDKAKNGHSHANEPTAAHSHDPSEKAAPHQHTSGQQLRTDVDGVVTAKLTADGIWYLQTIHLVNTEEEGFTHESNWTTLTFEVTHGHGADTHTHEHEEEGIPSYVYWIASLLIVGVLFFWFNRKN